MNSARALPIDTVLPDVAAALGARGIAVLCAPPGAGKTTRVPLHLLDADWLRGRRIIMLEPRRLAARAAATFMARLHGSAVGEVIGYRTRTDSRSSAHTRIDVVTEGILTRMLQSDPGLENVGAILFDEFHERSIHADLGLAFALQARELLRPDLRLLVMSATLDQHALIPVLGDPAVIVSEGREWPVETRWLDRPVDGHVDTATARVAARALDAHEGDVLVFLPGAAEIRRAESWLRDHVGPDVDVFPLHGTMPQALQDRALAPGAAGRRKIVLATSVAETSLTIEGVRIVVDSGLMRVPRFSPRTGMSRLHTARVTRAAADQRRGRAGRTAPGVCLRMWTRAEDDGLVPHRTPEILEVDLAPLALDLAMWGARDAAELRWIDPPPAAALAQGRALLQALHALDAEGVTTSHGRDLHRLGIHPRLAEAVMRAREIGAPGVACDIVAILSERDFMSDVRDPDIRVRIDALRVGDPRANRGALDGVRREAERWRRRVGAALSRDAGDTAFAGLLLACAFPDRIARRRGNATGRFLMRNSRGIAVDSGVSMATAEYIVAAAVDDRGADAPVLLGAPLSLSDLEAHFAEDIVTATTVFWDDATDRVRATRTRSLGAIVLEQADIPLDDDAAVRGAMVGAIRRKGLDVLPWSDDAIALRQRIVFAARHGAGTWPDVSDDALLRDLDSWLGPFLTGIRRLQSIDGTIVDRALRALLHHDQQRVLDRFAPSHVTVPTGSKIRIDYADPASPSARVRIQEVYGVRETPRIANGAVPITFHLLSPANRPIQVTRDLAGFWAGSYADLRKDMRGRYPRHDWPVDPASAAPSRRPRPRRPD